MTRNTVRALILVIAAILALVTVPSQGHAATRTTATHTSPTTSAYRARTEPTMARMVNCEDYDIQPCYTYDEGSYRIVQSYLPYTYTTLSMCKEEDGSGTQALPCIWKHNNRVAKGEPKTRNVFTQSNASLIQECLSIEAKGKHNRNAAKRLMREGWTFKECVKAQFGM